MNREAERHLTKAVGYVERGEGYYRKAAEEIVAATEADPTLSQREIGERIGRSKQWVQRLLAWERDPSSGHATPYGGQADAINVRKTKQILREAPMEQVEQIVATLPPERQKAIAAAAGHGYLGARQDYDEAERRRTPEDRREQAEARERLTRPVRQASGDFAALGIAAHLEQAIEELRELVADASLTPQAARRIRPLLDTFVTEFQFAEALLGEEAT